MPSLRPIGAGDHAWVLALNTIFETEISPLTEESLRALLDTAFMARAVAAKSGFMLAMDERASYESANYLWFKRRYPRFVYVDRVVIADHARGRGLADALYGVLIEKARAAGQSRIVCEVNFQPPNPASDAFRARMGFREVGQATLPSGKVVRYFELPL